jgi:transcriptional regulator with XRE-family HTH domain
MVLEDRRAEPARAIRRPASGFAIDPGALIRWRAKRAWSRDDLAARIAALNLTDTVTGKPYTVGKYAITKIENGGRSPKPRTLRALCLGLSTEDEPCQPEDLLLPDENVDGDWDDLGVTLDQRRDRVTASSKLRKFAEKHGIPFHQDGRVVYSRPLRDAYALAEAGAPEADVAEAVAVAISAAQVSEAVRRLTRSERARQPASQPAGLPDDALIDALSLAPAAHNALIRANIRTIGQLAARDRPSLAAAGVPAKAIREIDAAVTRHGRALRNDAAA